MLRSLYPVYISNLHTEITTKPKAFNSDTIECEENTDHAITNSSSILASNDPTTTLPTVTEGNVSSSDESIDLANDKGICNHTHVDDGYNSNNRTVTNRYCRGCGQSCSNNHCCDICGSSMHILCDEPIGKEGFRQQVRYVQYGGFCV